VNETVGYISALGIFLVSTYSIWLYNRLFFGNLAEQVQSYTDIDSLDKFVIQILLFFILVLGMFPSYITSFVYFDSLYLLALMTS
jgi:NADH:ubiquinone oxidoreductase subunit 4 (subunit M)